MKSFMQSFGKSLLLPISTIAVAGLFLGVAAALQNSAIVGESFTNMELVQNIVGFIRKLSGLVFGNLPVFFAISIALGMAKNEKATAAFSSLIGFLVFHLTINYLLGLNGITPETTSVDYLINNVGLSDIDAKIENSKYAMSLGYFSYRMDVFAGIIVGLVVTHLHNRYYQIVLPSSINFFGGKRFVPLITLLVLPLAGYIAYYIWPYLDSAISYVGMAIDSAGSLGAFIYGSLNRLMIPTGLHHVLNQAVRFTPIGGTAIIDGETVVGALNIFNAAIASNQDIPNSIVSIGSRYVGQGHMLSVMFGLPAAGFAMIRCAKPENRNKVKALIIAGVASSVLTGITEPLEFTFMFIAPVLFAFHVILYGLGFMLMDLFNVGVGGIQGGVIDFVIFGVLRGLETKWYMIVIFGLGFAAAYYFGFIYLINRYNIMTIGRESNEHVSEDSEMETSSISSSSESNQLPEKLVKALGGKDNISSIENCMTRLRVTVYDPKLACEKSLNDLGAIGVARPTPENIQLIYGLHVDQITTNVKLYLKTI